MAASSIKKKSARTKTSTRKKNSANASGKNAALPRKISPMLATLVDKPFDKPGWLYEVKWDGYRAMTVLNKGSVELISRNGKSFNEKFYPVYNQLQQWKLNAVIDGEIVVLDDNGMADFSGLQGWRSEADGDLVYYVFDILWLEGKDLTGLALTERKNILRKIIPSKGIVKMSENFETTGTAFYKLAQEMNIEGIMAKKADSTYSMGIRTQDWLKIKTNQRQEVVIGGYTRNEGSSKYFSSLLVGVYQNKRLQYTGKIGTGFSEKLQKEMLAQFKPLISKKCPFEEQPDINKPSRFRHNPPNATVTWLRPKLICEVSFTEMTTDHVMRHPSFEGMRSDKKASDVKLEKEKPVEKIIAGKKTKKDLIIGQKIIFDKANKGERNSLLNPSDEMQVRKVNGHELKFSNLSKIYWPKEKYSKRDLINYYYQVAPYMLPYLKDRPQSLNRYPNGIKGESFYQKDVAGKVPGWIKTYPYESDPSKHFLVVSDEASLLYMASLGCIEMNPWSSRVQSPGNPDWCIIDLDPDKTTFNQVIETAQVTRKLLESCGIPCYCKTSGSTGLHIYIPMGAKYSYEESKEFGRLIATIVHRELPKSTSIERLVSNRKGKMYIDFLQNRPQATLAAPYSLRPKPGATVSMPLHWEEVKKGMKMMDFNIKNSYGRVKESGDIFKPVLGRGINLKKAVKCLEQVKENL